MESANWNSIRTQKGVSLGQMSDASPVLVIFLRHYG